MYNTNYNYLYNTPAPTNTQIKTLYAPESSCLAMRYFRNYLTLDFAPYCGRDSRGFHQYSRKIRQSTSVDGEGAKLFYLLSKAIIDGSAADKPVNVVLPCRNDAKLIFDYKPDNNGQMLASLAIDKNKMLITFPFPLHHLESVDKDGKKVVTVIQRGLGAFAKVMQSYLLDVCRENGIERLPPDFNEYRDYNEQVANPQPYVSPWNNASL